MSTVINFGLLLVLFISCNSSEERVDPYFPPSEVISTLNALVSIIDWPGDTTSIQKKLSVTSGQAKKMMLPLHRIWDEKVNEVAMEILDWNKTKITSNVLECAKRCECDFYHEVFDRNPDILKGAPPEIKTFAGIRVDKTKEGTLTCLQNMPQIQNLIVYLLKEQKKYEADSIY